MIAPVSKVYVALTCDCGVVFVCRCAYRLYYYFLTLSSHLLALRLLSPPLSCRLLFGCRFVLPLWLRLSALLPIFSHFPAAFFPSPPLSCPLLHFPALSCAFLCFPALSCAFLRFPALSCAFPCFPALSCAFLCF